MLIIRIFSADARCNSKVLLASLALGGCQICFFQFPRLPHLQFFLPLSPAPLFSNGSHLLRIALLAQRPDSLLSPSALRLGPSSWKIFSFAEHRFAAGLSSSCFSLLLSLPWSTVPGVSVVQGPRRAESWTRRLRRVPPPRHAHCCHSLLRTASHPFPARYSCASAPLVSPLHLSHSSSNAREKRKGKERERKKERKG